MPTSEIGDPAPDAPADPRRRRALLVGGGALALVIGGGIGWIALTDDESGTDDGPPTDAREPLTGIIVVGERYLADHPEEADLDRFLADLPAGGDDPVRAASERVTGDFATGATVMVDGWVLALSEARAAAAIALRCRTEPC